MKRLVVARRFCRSRCGSSPDTLVCRLGLSGANVLTTIVTLTVLLVLVDSPRAPAQATFLAPVQSPRTGLDVPVVMTQAPAGSTADQAHTRLVLRSPDGTSRVLTAQFQSACDPHVSPDGKHILFAARTAAVGDRNVYELDLQKMTTRQVTSNAGDCRSPIYTSSFYTITEKEPWEQIAFVSTLARQADERGNGPATSLFTCKLDGSFLQRITYNLASDLDPVTMADGRLAFATWHRAGFESGVRGRLAVEAVNTDGSDRMRLVPERAGQFVRMPCVTTKGLLVFVEVDPTAGREAGRLSCVSLRRPLHTYRSITRPGDGLFATPSPLPDGRILVSWRPADGSTSFGLYRLDPETGRRELVFDDPSHDELRAWSLHLRLRPDGRSSVVSPDDSLAKLYCMSVYINDLKDRTWLSAGTVKTVRVIEGLPASSSGSVCVPAKPNSSPQLSARRILLETPLKPDGSFQITVPASTPIQIQLIDERGIALRSCGWIWCVITRLRGASAATRIRS